jgi:general secretion pathway protein M
MIFGVPVPASLWGARSRREQILLTVLAMLALLFLAWFGIASPLRRAAASADAGYTRAIQQLAIVETARREIMGSSGIAPLPDGGMAEAVTASAAASGMALARTRVESEREMTIWLSAVDARTFFAWAETLRKAHGVVVSNLTATRNEEGTLDVEALFARGAP